jgi:hypothetical protein
MFLILPEDDMKKILVTMLLLAVFMVVSCGGSDTGNTGDTGDTGNTGDTGDTGEPCETEEDEGKVRSCVDFESFERCVEGSWKTISLKHKGLEWSCRFPNTINWQDAMDYCEDNGWRLPTISELRTLIQNCPATETGGECGVTDSCLSGDCWNDSCSGCGYDSSGKYSVFGDTGWFWSSSSYVDYTDFAWYVNFNVGGVFHSYKTDNDGARCVR